MLVLFCPECTALSIMSAMLENDTFVTEDIRDQVQFQKITSIISHQDVNEICCVCQASILWNFFESSLLAADKMYLLVLFIEQDGSYGKLQKKCYLFIELLFHVFYLNITPAIRFTDILSDGCENGHAFCKLFFICCTAFSCFLCIISIILLLSCVFYGCATLIKD